MPLHESISPSVVFPNIAPGQALEVAYGIRSNITRIIDIHQFGMTYTFLPEEKISLPSSMRRGIDEMSYNQFMKIALTQPHSTLDYKESDEWRMTVEDTPFSEILKNLPQEPQRYRHRPPHKGIFNPGNYQKIVNGVWSDYFRQKRQWYEIDQERQRAITDSFYLHPKRSQAEYTPSSPVPAQSSYRSIGYEKVRERTEIRQEMWKEAIIPPELRGRPVTITLIRSEGITSTDTISQHDRIIYTTGKLLYNAFVSDCPDITINCVVADTNKHETYKFLTEAEFFNGRRSMRREKIAKTAYILYEILSKGRRSNAINLPVIFLQSDYSRRDVTLEDNLSVFALYSLSNMNTSIAVELSQKSLALQRYAEYVHEAEYKGKNFLALSIDDQNAQASILAIRDHVIDSYVLH